MGLFKQAKLFEFTESGPDARWRESATSDLLGQLCRADRVSFAQVEFNRVMKNLGCSRR